MHPQLLLVLWARKPDTGYRSSAPLKCLPGSMRACPSLALSPIHSLPQHNGPEELNHQLQRSVCSPFPPARPNQTKLLLVERERGPAPSPRPVRQPLNDLQCIPGTRHFSWNDLTKASPGKWKRFIGKEIRAQKSSQLPRIT